MFELNRDDRWQSLFEKYEKRGEMNTADCSFSEVNYKLFAKPRLLKRLKTKKKPINKHSEDNITCTNTSTNCDETENTIDGNNTSDIIDSDVHEVLLEPNKSEKNKRTLLTDVNKENNHKEIQNYSPAKVSKQNDNNIRSFGKENCIFTNQNSLEDLIRLIEEDLKSSLKETMVYRSECKILETDDYNYWHKCTKSEMKRLRKYITREELKAYMRHCSREDVNLNALDDVISSNMKNNIRQLLVKREFARNDKEKYLKYCDKIHAEWKKLVTDLPRDLAILYASCVINSIKGRKSTFSLSAENETDSGCAIELHKESHVS